MCLRVLSVCWAFVNTSTIWAPNSCAQNVGFPTQTGFPAAHGTEGPPGRQCKAQGFTWEDQASLPEYRIPARDGASPQEASARRWEALGGKARFTPSTF